MHRVVHKDTEEVKHWFRNIYIIQAEQQKTGSDNQEHEGLNQVKKWAEKWNSNLTLSEKVGHRCSDRTAGQVKSISFIYHQIPAEQKPTVLQENQEQERFKHRRHWLLRNELNLQAHVYFALEDESGLNTDGPITEENHRSRVSALIGRQSAVLSTLTQIKQ